MPSSVHSSIESFKVGEAAREGVEYWTDTVLDAASLTDVLGPRPTDHRPSSSPAPRRKRLQAQETRTAPAGNY